MRHIRGIYGLLALVAIFGAVAWGCSTDSPTAPRQTPAPPPAPTGQTHSISVSADPSGVALPEDVGAGSDATGNESTTLMVEVTNPVPADGTTVLVTTTLGSFDVLNPVQSQGLVLSNGRAFLTLFAGGLPVQLGVANVRATLNDSQGQIDVPIDFISAEFCWTNAEANESVNFAASSALADTFLWDFGDGTTSDLRSPLKIFPSPGTFTVRLTASRTIAGASLEVSEVMQVSTSTTACPGAVGF